MGRFGVISAVIFNVFLSFGECLGHLTTSLDPKGGSWSPLRRQTRRRVVFGVLGRRILRPRVAQETPRGANSDEKIAQRGPREIPKEGKMTKQRNLRHLDFERPYWGLATFTHLWGDQDRKISSRSSKTTEKYGKVSKTTKNVGKCCFWACPPPSKSNPPPDEGVGGEGWEQKTKLEGSPEG